MKTAMRLAFLLVFCSLTPNPELFAVQQTNSPTTAIAGAYTSEKKAAGFLQSAYADAIGKAIVVAAIAWAGTALRRLSRLIDTAKNEAIPLRTFSGIVERATKVAEEAESEFWMAVDIPAYGRNSASDRFPAYSEALASVVRRRVPNIHILWLSEQMEGGYTPDLRGPGPRELATTKASGDIRSLLKPFSPTESSLAATFFTNFWVSRDKHGKYHTVVTWQKLSPEMINEQNGFYTNSPEIAKTMTAVWQSWHDMSESSLSKTILAALNSRSSASQAARATRHEANPSGEPPETARP